MPLSQTDKRRLVASIIIIIGLVITLQVSYWLHLEKGVQDIELQSAHQLDELSSLLNKALARYENTPAVLARSPRIKALLEDGESKENYQKLNQYFEELQQVTQAADIYLINPKGYAISASNWRKGNTFIGQNYSFRPYFQHAVQGHLARYFAVGTSSNKRGFYFSAPVYSSKRASKLLGVMVVKLNIDQLEQQITGMAKAGHYEVIITGEDDIVFLSSVQSWRLGSLLPLTQERNMTINSTKRYASRQIHPLSISPRYEHKEDNASGIYRITSFSGTHKYMDTRVYLPDAQWHLHILSPMAPIISRLPMIFLLSASLFLLLSLSLLFSIERRRNHKLMQHAQDQLEQRVKERTQALVQANGLLKDTQDELVQAAKLTVIGNLSASINHEINQPLAALRSYAQNTLAFLERDNRDRAKENLNTIVKLSDRLADIVSQFKSFTRKSQGVDSATNVITCIQEALAIIKPEADKQGVAVSATLPSDTHYIWGDQVRLQQVLVNIFSNAIVAMNQSDNKQLIISLSVDSQVDIYIQDSGPGVRESQMEKIFEPYYTTSERQGLGLGLSISHRIIEAMQGKISVANAIEGGAIFTISLPIFSNE